MLKIEVKNTVTMSRNTLFASWYMADSVREKGKTTNLNRIVSYFNGDGNNWIYNEANSLIGRKTNFGIIGFGAIKEWLEGKGITVSNFSEIENDIAFLTSYITSNVNEGILLDLTKHASFVKIPDGQMMTLSNFESTFDNIDLPNDLKSMSTTQKSNIGVAFTDATFLNDLVGQGIILSWVGRSMVDQWEMHLDHQDHYQQLND